MLGILFLVIFLSLFVAVIGVVIYSFFRKRHGEESVYINSNLIKTAEVFRDPSTNRLMRVWVNPSNGKRVYLAEGQLPGNI